MAIVARSTYHRMWLQATIAMTSKANVKARIVAGTSRPNQSNLIIERKILTRPRLEHVVLPVRKRLIPSE